MSKYDFALSATSTTQPISVLTGDSVSALVTAGCFLEMLGVWQNLMRLKVFPLVKMPEDRSLEKTYQKRLLTQHAMSILLIVWKDSDQVTDAEVDAAGAERVGTSSSPINCHSLAKKMATSIDDYDRQEKIIQGIVKAAEAYGLIDREQLKGSRQKALVGSARLHELMCAFDRNIRPICSEIVAPRLEDL